MLLSNQMKSENIVLFSLSLRDVGVMKGFAIIAMLFFHIYGYPPHEVDPSTIPEWMHVIGNLGKLCVAIFVFCSGYGLAAQYKGCDLDGGLWQTGFTGTFTAAGTSSCCLQYVFWSAWPWSR